MLRQAANVRERLAAVAEIVAEGPPGLADGLLDEFLAQTGPQPEELSPGTLGTAGLSCFRKSSYRAFGKKMVTDG
jgi:hypothetical protein